MRCTSVSIGLRRVHSTAECASPQMSRKQTLLPPPGAFSAKDSGVVVGARGPAAAREEGPELLARGADRDDGFCVGLHGALLHCTLLATARYQRLPCWAGGGVKTGRCEVPAWPRRHWGFEGRLLCLQLGFSVCVVSFDKARALDRAPGRTQRCCAKDAATTATPRRSA